MENRELEAVIARLGRSLDELGTVRERLADKLVAGSRSVTRLFRELDAVLAGRGEREDVAATAIGCKRDEAVAFEGSMCPPDAPASADDEARRMRAAA